MVDNLKVGLDLLRALTPQEDIPLDVRVAQEFSRPQPAYEVERPMYAMADTSGRRPQPASSHAGHYKAGSGASGYVQDLETAIHGDRNSPEWKHAVDRLQMNLYFEDKGDGMQLIRDYSARAAYRAREEQNELLVALGYADKAAVEDDSLRWDALKKFIDDSGSDDLQTRYDLGLKYFNLGKQGDDDKMFRNAMEHFGWIADTYGENTPAPYDWDTMRHIGSVISRENRKDIPDKEYLIHCLEYVLKIQPDNKGVQIMLRETKTNL
jgi:hypothetical protein